tara:strand:+ start:6070 stop:6546 length:477 start_codon:yes stop_codon:yes gene_type:complete
MAKSKMNNINLFMLIPLIIYGGMIKYIVDLEKSQLCPCSATKNRTDLKKLLVTWICLLLGSLLSQVIIKDKKIKAQLLNVIGISSVVVFIYFSIIFFKYEGEMYKSKCECSEDIKRTVFKYYLYSIYVILVLQILFMIFFIVMMVYTSNQKSVVKVNL